MNTYNFPALITALAYAISEKCTDEEIDLISTLLTQLGDTLTSLLASKSFDSKNCLEEKETKKSSKDNDKV